MAYRHPHVVATGRCVYCDKRPAVEDSDYCRTCPYRIRFPLSDAQVRTLATLETTGKLVGADSTIAALERRGIIDGARFLPLP